MKTNTEAIKIKQRSFGRDYRSLQNRGAGASFKKGPHETNTEALELKQRSFQRNYRRL